MKSQLGVVGLGTMGTNLSRNLGRNGFILSLYNRHLDGLEENVAKRVIDSFNELKNAQGFDDMSAFVQSLDSPRVIILMIDAGDATGGVIDSLVPLLATGDVVIDGGNAHYQDTISRVSDLHNKGIHFLGCGISGGTEGALYGPSIMPGGSKKGYAIAEPILKKIAALDYKAQPCCNYIGPGGAGHVRLNSPHIPTSSRKRSHVWASQQPPALTQHQETPSCDTRRLSHSTTPLAQVLRPRGSAFRSSPSRMAPAASGPDIHLRSRYRL